MQVEMERDDVALFAEVEEDDGRCSYLFPAPPPPSSDTSLYLRLRQHPSYQLLHRALLFQQRGLAAPARNADLYSLDADSLWQVTLQPLLLLF